MDKLEGQFSCRGNIIMLESVIVTLSQEQIKQMNEHTTSENVQFIIIRKEDGTLTISA